MNWKALIAVVLLPSVVQAQTLDAATRPTIPVPQLELEYTPPPLIAVPDGEDRIQHVEKGEPAPYSGQLFDPSTALRWAHYLQQAKLRLREDVLYERRVCNAHLGYMGHRVELEVQYGEAVESDLRKRALRLEQRNVDLADEIRDPGLFKSPGFWFAVGVLTTGALTGLGVLVASRVN
jgi:hypothetical protein